MIKLKCGNCGRSLKAPDEAAGQRGRCPGCGKVFIIPNMPVGKAGL